jgi:tetratricopeptide (TPR) repeat protein
VHFYRFLLILFATLAIAQSPKEGLALNERGLAAADRGNYGEAEQYYRQAVGIYRPLGPQFEAHLSVELFNLAESLCGQGKWRESQGLFEESLTLTRRTLGQKHIRAVAGLNALGNVSMLMGDPEHAESLLREALAIARENYPADLQLAHTLAALSSLRLRAQKPEEGLPYAEEALSLTLKADGEEGSEAAMMYQNVAQIHRTAGRPARAIPLFHKARAILERLGRTNEPRYASLLSQEGLALMDDGNLAMAERDMKRAIELLSRSNTVSFELASAQNNLGLLRIRQKKYAEADELLSKALSAEQNLSPTDAAQIGRTRDALEKVRMALR